jgi:GNAT superfamily N-acetyltransferase
MQITVDPELKPEDGKAILDALIAFNNKASGNNGPFADIGILLKNDAGKTEGGLTARLYYEWMFIELLFVPESLRGQNFGTRLMAEAERIARDRGLRGIWLDTFAFQARGFYEKLGYSIFGELADYPVGFSRYFLQKRLATTQLTGQE